IYHHTGIVIATQPVIEENPMRPQLLLLALLLMFTPVTQSHAQAGCTVDENYIETVTENTGALLRINVLLNSGGGPLNDVDNARVSFRQLISMREYHESLRATLPDCALPINTEMIDTIVAAQDLFGTIFLQGLDFQNFTRYDDELAQAAAELRAEFAALNEATAAAALVPADE
ncbi:MAG: hypothetical protein AAF653_21375, partial [Chloroflexota bacterium]